MILLSKHSLLVISQIYGFDVLVYYVVNNQVHTESVFYQLVGSLMGLCQLSAK